MFKFNYKLDGKALTQIPEHWTYVSSSISASVFGYPRVPFFLNR
jgi:hypothetical protein